MIPEIELLSSVKVNWPSFKATMEKVLDERPDRTLSQCPVNFTQDAEYLLYLAATVNIPVNNPLNVLRNLPHNLLEHLHYTYMVACDSSTYNRLMIHTQLQVTGRLAGEVHWLLVTGPLSTWLDTIVLYLTQKNTSNEMRILMDKFILAFNKLGLQAIFDKYNKVDVGDGTFLLEHKR